MISAETARFLLWLVNQQRPHAGAPDFTEAVAQIVTAQRELQEIVDTVEPAEPNPRFG